MKLSATTPTVWLAPEVDQRLRAWTEIAAGEFSALGMVEETDGGFVVTKIFLPKQTCGAADTELDQAAVAQLLTELDASGEDISGLRLWAHSHADFKVFWSGTDEGTVRQLANGEWTLALVVNKAGERRCRLDLWTPVHVTLDELPVSVFHEDLGLRADCERLFAERVKEVQSSLLAQASTTLATLSHPGEHRQGLLDDRMDPRSAQARYPHLGWSDLDDLLDPTLDDERGSRVGP